MFRAMAVVVAGCLTIVLSVKTYGQNPQSYLLAWQGDVEVLFTPDPEPLLDGDLMAGVLSLRSPPGTSLVTFGEITLTNLHHVARLGVFPTPNVTDLTDPIHVLFDSHLLITPDMIGGSAGDPLREIGFDDPSAVDPAGIQHRIPDDAHGISAATYRGDIVHGNGAFFIRPEFHSNSIDLARLVGVPGDISNISFLLFGGRIGEPTFDVEFAWIDRGSPPGIDLNVPGNFVEVGQSAVLSAEVSDSDNRVDLVEFFDNGTLIPGCSFTTGPYECEWTPELDRRNHLHEVRATATDASGNMALSAAHQVSVWTLGPTVFFSTGVTADTIQVGHALTLTANAQDPDGVSFVDFLANDELIPGCHVTDPVSQNNYRCDWTPEAGSYSLTARAHDTVGHASQAELQQLNVVETARIELNPPASPIWNGNSQTLTADVGGPITLVEYFANDELILNCRFTSAPYDCEWIPDEGFYRVRVRGTDHEGNLLDSREYAVSVRNPIQVTLTSPQADRALRVGESVVLAADATHHDGEISSLAFYANDEPIASCNFSSVPSECEWIPDEGEYVVMARAADISGSFGDSRTSHVDVYPPGSVGVGDGLPVDENGIPILEVETVGQSCPACDGGPDPIRPGFVYPLSVRVPIGIGGPVTLLAVDEINDAANVYAYIGDEPPIRYEPTSSLVVGPFSFEALAAGDFSATYELSFDDGSSMFAILNTTVVPEPAAWQIILGAMILLSVHSRAIAQIEGAANEGTRFDLLGARPRCIELPHRIDRPRS